MYTVEEFDKCKTKVFKYITYKKRTENEIRIKFTSIIEEDILNDIIEYYKNYGYINDVEYINKAISEYMKLKNLSIKEVKYKLSLKGINRNLLENYIDKNEEEMIEYEMSSAIHISDKKLGKFNEQELKMYLAKKGYKGDTIRKVIDTIEK